MMDLISITNYVYELREANKELKEFPIKKIEKTRKLFKLVKEFEKEYEKEYMPFELNVEISKTYNKAKRLYKKIIRVKKLEEVYEETKELEQKHIDSHEKMIESCKKEYIDKVFSTFQHVACKINEITGSYDRMLNKIDDEFRGYYIWGNRSSSICGKSLAAQAYKILVKESERIEEIVNRTNKKEVKKILDALGEENIKINNMLKLHEKELEKTKKILEKTKLEKGDLSSQSLILEMLQYIRSSIKEIEAFKKEYKAFKAYEKLEEDFNKVEEEVAFETFKRAFEDVKEPCKRLINQPMSNVDSLFQAFEKFCGVRESCVKKLGSNLNLMRRIKGIVMSNLRFKLEIDDFYAWESWGWEYDYDEVYEEHTLDGAYIVDEQYEKIESDNLACADCIHRCGLDPDINYDLRRELQEFPITVDLISELIRRIKRIVMDNLHFEFTANDFDRDVIGRVLGARSMADYDCKFSKDIDSKLLEVLSVLPDKLALNEAKKAKKMLRKEWKKWAKMHNYKFITKRSNYYDYFKKIF